MNIEVSDSSATFYRKQALICYFTDWILVKAQLDIFCA